MLLTTLSTFCYFTFQDQLDYISLCDHDRQRQKASSSDLLKWKLAQWLVLSWDALKTTSVFIETNAEYICLSKCHKLALRLTLQRSATLLFKSVELQVKFHWKTNAECVCLSWKCGFVYPFNLPVYSVIGSEPTTMSDASGNNSLRRSTSTAQAGSRFLTISMVLVNCWSTTEANQCQPLPPQWPHTSAQVNNWVWVSEWLAFNVPPNTV